jgi:hypothetical protein
MVKQRGCNKSKKRQNHTRKYFEIQLWWVSWWCIPVFYYSLQFLWVAQAPELSHYNYNHCALWDAQSTYRQKSSPCGFYSKNCKLFEAFKTKETQPSPFHGPDWQILDGTRHSGRSTFPLQWLRWHTHLWQMTLMQGFHEPDEILCRILLG